MAMTNADLDPARVARIAVALAVAETDPQHSLCVASAAAIGVAGAGVILMSGGRALGNVCVSGSMTAAAEEVQYTLGEGPCVDAYHTKAPVLAPDLEHDGDRWPGFRVGAARAGVRAVFGFPLLIEAVCFGALNLYHDRPGPLTADQFADALAHVASRTVLGWQSVAGPGSLAWQLEHVPMHRAVVHQAAGMVSVQAAVPIPDAVVMLRAYAFAEDRPISEVAASIVNGDLRLDGTAA
jgi:GAF domain-containing protein